MFERCHLPCAAFLSNRELAQKLIRNLARIKWHIPFKLQRNRNHKIKTKLILILLFILILSAVNQTKATTTTTIPAIGDIFINEYVPDSDTEWVELYNSSATDLDISRHYLDDMANGGQAPKQIPDGTIIPANGYYVMEFNAYFNNNGDKVRFLAPNQTTVLDSHTYTSSTPEKAWSRAPDGQQWRCVTSTTPTKGSSNPGTNDNPWQPGLFEIHIFDVGQGDSQLIIFPSGYTILIDVAEHSDDSGRCAALIAAKIRTITGSSHINVGVLSHLHLDHIGYAGFGGFWKLLEEEAITFDKIIDRDAGMWVDGRDGTIPDGSCDPENEITWHNAGEVSGTAKQWLCYATNPANSKIYPIRQLAQLGSTTQIDPPDAHAQVEIIQVDAATVMLADGITPLAGDHSMDPIPPSENDYSIALKISYGQIDYITAGDTSGKYNFRYNDVESVIAPWIGPVEILHVNHHGSGSSSNQTYLETLAPATAFISCGTNSYDHPDQAVLERLTAVSDVYLTNYCAAERDYSDATVVAGDIILRSRDGLTYTLNSPINPRTTLYLPLIMTH